MPDFGRALSFLKACNFPLFRYTFLDIQTMAQLVPARHACFGD